MELSKTKKAEMLMKNHSKDKDYILKYLAYNLFILKFVDKGLLKNKEFVLKVVEKNGLALRYVSSKLKNDKEVVMRALQNSAGFALKYASKELRADREVVSEAIKRWKAPLKYASPELQEEYLAKINAYYKKHQI